MRGERVSIISKLLRGLGRKSVNSDYGRWYNILVGGSASDRRRLGQDSTYADFMTLGYARNATVRSCVDLLAQAVGSVNYLYYKGKGTKATKALDSADELDELDERHPIVEMLEEPNSEQGRAEWLQQYVMYMTLGGNAYLFSALDVTGNRPRKSELWWLDPDAVEPQARKRAGEPRVYVYRPEGGQEQRFTAEQVLHIKAGGTGDEGTAPALAAAEAINQNNLARLWNSDLLSNSGRPSAIGKWTGAYELDEAQMQAKAQELASFFKPENSGKFLFTQLTDIQLLGLTPEQMAYVEGLKESMREICRAFRVPSQLLGDSDSATYSNYREARKSLYHEVVIPYSEMLTSALQRWLRVWEPGLIIVPDTDNIEALQEDANARFERANAAQFLTVNERRLLSGYDALEEGGDVVLVPAGLMPLDQLTLAAEYTGDVMPGREEEPEEAEQTEAEQAEDEDEAQAATPAGA